MRQNNFDFGSILGAASGILGNITIGDQVKGYPIKSKNTLANLQNEINGNIPAPQSIADAQTLILKAEQLIAAAANRPNNKEPVKETVRMLYREKIQALNDYIQRATALGLDENDLTPPGNPGHVAGASKDNTIWFVIGGLVLVVTIVLVVVMMKKRK